MRSLNLKLIRDLNEMKTQALTIALLIMGGLSVLVSSWSSYESLQAAKEDFYTRYNFSDVFAEFVKAPESIENEIRSMSYVDVVEGRVVTEGLVDLPSQKEPALGRFISWREGQVLNKIYLRSGRLPDTDSEIVVHESFAQAHGINPGYILRVVIKGKEKSLIVSGIGISPEYVYALSPIAPLPDDKHFGVFWIKHSGLQTMAGLNESINSLQIKIRRHEDLGNLKLELDSQLNKYGTLGSYSRDKQISNIFVEDEIRQQKVMSMVMPAIFLAVAMFILNVILSRLITLHRAKIATLKSIGYSHGSIFFHYFLFVTLILILGIVPSLYTGAKIGEWYADLYADFFRFPVINFNLSAKAILISIAAGLLPGWLGSLNSLTQVFTMRPAEALRPPSPPAFQTGVIEKIGLDKKMSVFSKMVVRSLLFRPVRLFLSIFGISMAIGILINGSFWTDVINFMIDRQFYEMKREDVSVHLTTPRASSVLLEINRLPGVIYSEAERIVPVRLKSLNISKDTSLIGLDVNGKMTQILDKGGQKIALVPNSVIMSRYFEVLMGIKVGDVIELEMLRGDRHKFSVSVAAFIDDLIGQQIYAVNSDLSQWIRESEAYNVINLKVDPQLTDELYLKLKQMPNVAAVTVRKLTLKGFRDTVANMITTFTAILFLFAISIAGSVMYNAARVSFSEKSWELASLRILGHDVQYTFFLLYIDIGIQALLAVVPGLLFGYILSYLSTRLIHNDTFMFPLIIEPATYAVGVLVLIMTFYLSGLFLYRKVARINFSEALKARE